MDISIYCPTLKHKYSSSIIQRCKNITYNEQYQKAHTNLPVQRIQ